MIEIESRVLADIPVLHAYPVGQKDTPLPCVIFYHGFTSSSLVYSYFAVALAQAGLRVIMPDAPDHGSRFRGDAARRLNQFWQILLQSMQEFTTLRAAIAEENWLLADRLAVGGASMGAMTALGITARHPTVRCTASMMGSGYFTSLARSLFPPLIPETAAQQNEFNSIIAPLAEWEATNHLTELGNRPLLLWHGLDDDVVPADESLRLQQALSETGRDKLLTCPWQPGVRHRITPEALDAAVTFFRQHL
ncbi:esterase [Escherichia coli]|uniref:esterase n=1 Tax=Escherichia coli TaxID=562 RepID=UPI0006A0E838|nr:esterase [Escherichia coli]EFA4799744.1 esterase [Escherichia coli]EFH3312179.1 esterase [Escherichia coli]EFK3805857.1 esterase [Escherichia coli]EGE1766679.1 esterase [Escherichia coli]EHQ2584493.1 esterase [Escherichia coli]